LRPLIVIRGRRAERYAAGRKYSEALRVAEFQQACNVSPPPTE